ncbi:MAG: substrate-binding domain-containing protein [Clostridia bacterium]|nr:substrate-binding domain-containing protein [Clostridia bacterium]
MKKIFAVIMCLILLSGNCVFYNVAAETESAFTVVKIPAQSAVYGYKARYADTKQPIHLSEYYDGYVFATIPLYNADREIEAFEPEEITFTDYDTTRYEFSMMKWLAQSGVILGDDKGQARPFDNVTRAEAVAMVMRFLGLDADSDLPHPFDDVSDESWYRDAVAAAYNAGIVKGDSANVFAPDRYVSREEITVMTVRAIECAHLAVSRDGIVYAADKDAISEWAVESYELIGSSAITEPDNTDPENPTRVFLPQKVASRFDVAYILYYSGRMCQLYPSQAAIEFGFDKDMPIIDGSTSTYPFTEAVYNKLFSNGYNHSHKPTSHSKSHASYQRLINGEVDMLFASVYPASDIMAMASEKGVELELIPIAYDAMIFFTNIENPSKGLTKEQITDIYVNNAYENWSQVGGGDALLYPYCRNYDSGSHAQMERHFLNGSDIHEKIRTETTSRTMSNVLTDVMEAKTDNPLGYGLGYSIYYYYHNMDPFYSTSTELKLLEIDGVAPTDETIADGTYSLSNNTYVVIRKDTPEDAPARKMAEFMLTEIGQECVQQAGYGRLK